MQSKYDNLFWRILDDDDDGAAAATIVVFTAHYINTHGARRDQVLLFAIR